MENIADQGLNAVGGCSRFGNRRVDQFVGVGLSWIGVAGHGPNLPY